MPLAGSCVINGGFEETVIIPSLDFSFFLYPQLISMNNFIMFGYSTIDLLVNYILSCESMQLFMIQTVLQLSNDC